VEKKMQMNEITALKEIIKDSVKEALREERLALYETLIPLVSKKEQKEIEKIHGSPADYNENEFTDLTDWVLS
jgi:hypothetical protein